MERRYRYTSGVKKGFLLKYGLIIFTVVGVTILYLWEQARVAHLDFNIRRMQKTIKDLEDENGRLTVKRVSLTGGSDIVKRAEEELKMIYPTEKTIVILNTSQVRPAPAQQDSSARHPQVFTSSDGHQHGKSLL
jgi:cell division protein FtsL